MMSTKELEHPWLLQTAAIKQDRYPDSTISDAVELTYMGRAEYEFGAMPASLRAIHANAGDYRLAVLPGITTARTKRPLNVFTSLSPDELDIYGGWLQEVIDGKRRVLGKSALDGAVAELPLLRYKEFDARKGETDPNPSYLEARFFPRQCKTKAQRDEYAERDAKNQVSLWWDLGNNLMFSFDQDFLGGLEGHLRASWRKMGLEPELETLETADANFTPRP